MNIQIDWSKTTVEEQIQKLFTRYIHLRDGVDLLMIDKARRDLGDEFPLVNK